MHPLQSSIDYIIINPPQPPLLSLFSLKIKVVVNMLIQKSLTLQRGRIFEDIVQSSQFKQIF